MGLAGALVWGHVASFSWFVEFGWDGPGIWTERGSMVAGGGEGRRACSGRGSDREEAEVDPGEAMVDGAGEASGGERGRWGEALIACWRVLEIREI